MTEADAKFEVSLLARLNTAPNGVVRSRRMVVYKVHPHPPTSMSSCRGCGTDVVKVRTLSYTSLPPWVAPSLGGPDASSDLRRRIDAGRRGRANCLRGTPALLCRTASARCRTSEIIGIF
ncbi:hypothetical protein VTK73DRAFT_8646 [Phialemonium thermophilum]|uniref:Uncharacterized protein n=1 Tax=Phialemonium thermophilum TaxID=223376 RepID=A0ABR3W7H4_9PEZI